MKINNESVEVHYIINGKTYKPDYETKDLSVGDLVFDLRQHCFISMENKKDLIKFSYVPPECYFLLAEHKD